MADDLKLVVGVDYSDLTGLIKTGEQTKRVLSSAAKDFARTGNQKQYMHSINKIVQSQKQLDASSRMNRSQLMQLGAEMQREAKFTDELSRATHRLSGAMGASRNKMNGSNMAVQQLGYQVGDFAVQVQGGTSAFVAFSQQGAQLAGMLPMIAGPLGLSMKMAVGLSAAFGILIPIGSAIARMFFEMKDSAKEAAEEAETLDNKLESLNGTLEDYANTLAALQAGVSLDELFATQGIDRAVQDLRDAQAVLDELRNPTKSNGEQDLTRIYAVAGAIEDEAEALKVVIEARTRLQLLLEKEADTRASNFAESSVAMKQELELLQAQARHGEDSAQAKNAELDQELRNRLAAIDAQVVSGELDEAAAASLKLQAERAAELTAQIEAAAAAEERRVAAIQVFYAYQAQLLDQQQQRQAGVDAIADAMQRETDRLNNQISLNQKIAQFGEDSVEVAEERASQAREAYAQSLMDQKILGSNLRTQMAAYDLSVQAAKVAKERLETDRKRAELKAHTADQQERLALAKAELDHGKESFEVAELRAEQEGIAKGYTDAALQSYIDTEMVIRDIVKATEASTRNAAEFAKVDISAGVRAAAEAAQRLATHLGISLRSAMAMQGMISTRMTGDVFDPRDPRNQGSDAALERARRIMEGGSLTDSLIPDESGGGGSDPFDQKAYLDSLQEEANFKQSLVGINDEAVANMERRREITKRIEDEGLVADEERILNILLTEAATRKAIDAEEQRQATFDKVSGHIESAFMAMVDGSKSVEDAFKGMIRSILLDVYQQAVAEPMANALTSFLKFNANGNAFSNGNVIPFANGGVVSSATMFPMAGNQTGVMGEAGPEAIMPLKRGANGKLGVQVQGGGENVVINQNFNFQANGDDSVKRIIAQAAPQIANMTKKSMIDDRRRGGQMKATFG